MALSRRAFTAALTSVALAPKSTAQTLPPFQVDDQVITDPQSEIQDIEFDWYGARTCWQDKQGNIWVANVNPYTGSFIPSSGKGQLVDTNAAGIAATGNGPEWLYGSNGTELVYTKFTNSNRNQFVVYHASYANGVWTPTMLPGSINGNAPIASLTPGDPSPRFKYFIGPPSNKRQYLVWQELYDPNIIGVIPDATAIAGRWVVGERLLILTTTIDNVRQVVLYNVDTGILNQLTFDPGDKNNPFMWRAADFNNELIFFATTSGTYAGVYRQINGVWTKIKEVKPPSPRPFLLSPEEFYFNNRSYLYFLMSDDSSTSNHAPADVWIAGIDPAVDFYRQVSDPSELVRADPEVFYAHQGCFIYYNEPHGPHHLIHRCATGLGPNLNSGTGPNFPLTGPPIVGLQ